MDGTSKVFLCSEGQLDDVSTDVKAFLDYMKGLPSADDFVNEIDGFIKEIKVKEEERVSYMTYEMKMREAHDDGKEENRVETALEMLKDSMSIDKIIKYTKLGFAGRFRGGCRAADRCRRSRPGRAFST